MSAETKGPIFIVGAPRSGTSLLRVMLNRHPEIGLCDETFYFYYTYQRRRAFGDLANPAARERLVHSYLATSRITRLRLDQQELATALIREGTSYDRMFAALLQFYARAQGRSRWGEKTPQHALVARTLCEWYPTASIIHIVRDPRDVVASLLRMPWGSRSVVLNARTWQLCTAAAERCRDLPNYLLVRYESLVQAPEPELHRICAAIGEPFTPALLDASRPGDADRWWFQRAQGPVTTRRRDTWQQELSRDDVALIEHVTADQMRLLDYQPTGQRLPPAALARGYGRAAYESAAARVRNLPRLWYHWARPADLAAEEAWLDRHSQRSAKTVGGEAVQP